MTPPRPHRSGQPADPGPAPSQAPSSQLPTAVLTPAVQFRTANVNDVPLIQHLAQGIWNEAYVALLGRPQVDYMLSRMYDTDRLQSEFAAGRVYEILEVDGVPAGYLSVSEAADPRGPITLHKLYLRKAYHGHGLGQRALERIQSRAVSAGRRQVRLRVNKGNELALKAYRRAGFRIIEDFVEDIGGGFQMDDFVMAWP